MITAFFANWFSRLPELKSRDKRLAESVLHQDKAGWDSLILDCKIPSEVADKLWTAFQPRSISPEGLAEAHRLSDYVPSLSEFKQYIKTLNPRCSSSLVGFRFLYQQIDNFSNKAIKQLTARKMEEKTPHNLFMMDDENEEEINLDPQRSEPTQTGFKNDNGGEISKNKEKNRRNEENEPEICEFGPANSGTKIANNLEINTPEEEEIQGTEEGNDFNKANDKSHGISDGSNEVSSEIGKSQA